MRTWLREKVPASCLAGFGASPNLLRLSQTLFSGLSKPAKSRNCDVENSVSGLARVCNLATSFQRFQMLSGFHAMELRLLPLTPAGCTCQRAWSDLFVCVSAHEWSH